MKAFYALRNFITDLINIAEHVASRHGGKMPETTITMTLTHERSRAMVTMEHLGVVGVREVLDPVEAIAELVKMAKTKYIPITKDATEGRR